PPAAPAVPPTSRQPGVDRLPRPPAAGAVHARVGLGLPRGPARSDRVDPGPLVPPPESGIIIPNDSPTHGRPPCTPLRPAARRSSPPPCSSPPWPPRPPPTGRGSGAPTAPASPRPPASRGS